MTIKTPCQCDKPGFCTRHQVEKHQHHYKLCQESMKYFLAWEKGVGPGQFGTPPKTPERKNAKMVPYDKWPKYAKYLCRRRKAGQRGVGDSVEALAAKLGGRLFKKFTSKYGIPCGCAGRQRVLNEKFPYQEDISPDAPNCYIPLTTDKEITKSTSP